MNDASIEKCVAEEMIKCKVENPVIFTVLHRALLNQDFINKSEVMSCLLKILEKIKLSGILTLELIISPETFEEIENENRGKNLHEEFQKEILEWARKISYNLAVDVGITLTTEITYKKDQEKTRGYMGIILKTIRLERESEKK